MRTGFENREYFAEWRKLRSLACVFGFAMAIVHADAAVIDNFSQGAALLQPTNYWPAAVVLQTGLNTNSTIGGTRRLSAQTQNQATLQVETNRGELSFEAVNDFGYFTLGYGTESPLSVDLKADGSDAFLLTFSNVSTPGLWRGIYTFRVNGIGYDLLPKLAAINGRGTIRIPFSHFSTAAQFVANQITLEGARVESSYRLVLDSIVTALPPLSAVTLTAGEVRLQWSTNVSNFVVETTSALDVPWQVVSNAVSVVGGQYSVTVGTAQPNGYFRLRRQ